MPPLTLDGEEWRAIPGWEGFYEVSNLGRVRSLDRVVVMGNRWGQQAPRRLCGKVLALFQEPSGYVMVGLHREGSIKSIRVHRLVCAAFHGPPASGRLDAAHNDGDGSNNRASNLRWDTRVGNMADTTAHRTRQLGQNHKSAKLTDAQVREIRAAKHVHADTIAARYGIHRVYVYKIWRGEARRTR